MNGDVAIGLLGAVGVLLGLVGTVLPALPGLLLVFVATAGTLLLQGTTGSVWAVVAVLGVLAVAGTVLSMVLPARRAAADGAPRSSLLAALGGAVVGFFVIPVLGLIIGGVLGLLVAEQSRLGEWRPAWASSRRVLAAYGVGVALELLVGAVMGTVWLTAFVARAV